MSMFFMHDVWVNWCEGEENGYNIHSFHEWRKSDTIELLEKVPLLHLSDDLYMYIENQLYDLPQELLNDVSNQAILRKNHERLPLEYAFIATDGKNVLAVDTIGYMTPMKKSRLIPRQEQLALEIVHGTSIKKYAVPKGYEEKEFHILSPHPKYMIGLTRKEKQLKQLLFMQLDHLYAARNEAEVKYWYTEWAPEKYESIQKMTFESAWKGLYAEVQKNWSPKHEYLCERLAKNQAYFEQVYMQETESKDVSFL